MPKKLKNENYLGFILIILALMAFAIIVKSCNISQFQHQQQVINNATSNSD
ncbi:MAG: hypothetical protein RBR22_02400 [Desulfuromonas sp.]|nr:hypothetical protein [Desulfuromonas sp.]